MINVHFNEVEALRRFDRLVNIGVIKYTDAAAVALFDKGFKVGNPFSKTAPYRSTYSHSLSTRFASVTAGRQSPQLSAPARPIPTAQLRLSDLEATSPTAIRSRLLGSSTARTLSLSTSIRLSALSICSSQLTHTDHSMSLCSTKTSRHPGPSSTACRHHTWLSTTALQRLGAAGCTSMCKSSLAPTMSRTHLAVRASDYFLTAQMAMFAFHTRTFFIGSLRILGQDHRQERFLVPTPSCLERRGHAWGYRPATPPRHAPITSFSSGTGFSSSRADVTSRPAS